MGRWPSGETFTFEYLHVRVVRQVDLEGSYTVASIVKDEKQQELTGTFQNLCFSKCFYFPPRQSVGL